MPTRCPPITTPEAAALLTAHQRGDLPWRTRASAPPGVHVTAEGDECVVTVSVPGSGRWAQELTGDAALELADRLLRASCDGCGAEDAPHRIGEERYCAVCAAALCAYVISGEEAAQ